MVLKRRKISVAAAGTAGLLCLGTISGAVGASAAGASTSGRTILAGSLVTAKARQHPVGAVSKSARMNFELVLKLRDAAGAVALLKAVSTPGSASYRHYLSTARWESRYSPSARAVSTARAWLRGEGFKVGAVSKDRITVSASGTAGQVERAFGTRLENYRLNGRTVRFAATPMSLPTSVAGSVLGAMGVNQNVATPDAAARTASRASSKITFPPAPPAFITAKPCGRYYNQKITTVKPPFGDGYPKKVPYNVCGYKPPQFRTAYNVGSSSTGKGVTVAIIDAYGSATIASDATRYFKTNDPGNPFARAHFSQLLPSRFNLSSQDQALCDPSSWLVEQAIDVEAVHSTAPNAHILYVGAKDCLNGLFQAEQNVIDNRLASVVTNSWGDDAGDLLDSPATKTAYDDLFLLAGGTGMTVQFSSGDDGDNFNLFGFSSSDFPTESPFVTSVGGTSLQVGSKGQQIGQLGWATGRSFKCTANAVNELPGCTKKTLNTWLPVSYDGGSGGFTSYYFTQPWYQAPVVPSSLAFRNEALTGSTPMRVDPDISMDADPSTGFLIGLHQTFPNGKAMYSQTRYGGTSLASPLLAGVVADADQVAADAGGADVGFINPAIYRISTRAGGVDDILPGGKQAQLRVDHASTYLGTGAKGFLYSFRQLTYEGPIVYCDATGNCASRPNTLSTAKGYDSMTGLGAPGSGFVTDLGKY